MYGTYGTANCGYDTSTNYLDSVSHYLSSAYINGSWFANGLNITTDNVGTTNEQFHYWWTPIEPIKVEPLHLDLDSTFMEQLSEMEHVINSKKAQAGMKCDSLID